MAARPSRAARRECYPILQAWGLHRFALAAWLVFAEALANHRIDSLFEQIRQYYRRYRVLGPPG